MNCREFERNILTVVRGELTSGHREHTQHCGRCANRLTEEQSLVASFRAVIHQVGSQNAPASTEALLLAAFRQHAAISSSAQLVLGGFVSTRLAFAFATLILSTAILSLVAFEKRWSDSSTEARIPAISLADLQPSITIEGSPANQAVHSTKRKVTKRRPVPQPVVTENEIVTEFFPLSGEDADSIQITQLMRVELPASAMIDVGLPVVEEELNRPVTAEIALGEDGIAYAIRFVRSADR
jgi:hypothetical protein